MAPAALSIVTPTAEPDEQQPPPESDGPMLVDVNRTAKRLDLSVRMVWSMAASGQMPAPLKLGRRRLWSVRTLEDWVRLGCLPVDQFEAELAAERDRAEHATKRRGRYLPARGEGAIR